MVSEFKRIALIDMDGLVIPGNANILVAKKRKYEPLALGLEKQRKVNEIDTKGYNKGIAPVFTGLTEADIYAYWDELPKILDVKKTAEELKRRKVMPVIITCGLGDFARICKEKFGFYEYHGAELIFDGERSTGARNRHVKPEDKIEYGKQLCDKSRIGYENLIAVEDSWSGRPLFEFVRSVGGLTIALNDHNQDLTDCSDYHLISNSLYIITEYI
jgi:phosphoserine phosphatase